MGHHKICCGVMEIRQKQLCVIGIFLTVGILFLSGCEESSPNVTNNNETKIELKNSSDDGYMEILTDVIESTFGTIILESDQPLIVGLITGGDNNLTARGIFRFDLSEWNGSDLLFHVKCVGKGGNPGEIEVYLTNDSGILAQSGEMENISETWHLVDGGEKLSELSPSLGNWIEVPIPKDKITAKKSNNNYITIIIKLSNEDMNSNEDYYFLATYDYTPTDNSDIPYLTYQ